MESPEPVQPPPPVPANFQEPLWGVPAYRMGIHPKLRLMMSSTGAFFVGAGLGAIHGTSMAGMRFRAEHAHKLPTDTTGWYFYHKSKNYAALRGGVLEGFKMGFKTCFWTSAILHIEDMFDGSRGTADAFNSILASLTVAGMFSIWNRFTIPEAGRTARIALVAGIAWGGLQDVAGFARGRRIGYIEFVKKHSNKVFGRQSSVW